MNALRWTESLLLSLPLRLFLGGLFVFAAAMKLYVTTESVADPVWNFAESVRAYRLIPMPQGEPVIVVLAHVIPWSELLAGLMLLLGVWTRPAALLVLVQLAVFAGANAWVVLKGIPASCSCFGDLGWPCGSSVTWCQVLRNLVLMVPAAVLLWRGSGLAALVADGWAGRVRARARADAGVDPDWADA